MIEKRSYIPGAKALLPGDFDNLSDYQRRVEIIERAKYLVNDNLEEPPHIKAARAILKKNGGDWLTASENEICDIVDQLPRPIFDKNIWKRREKAKDPEFDQVMGRIYQTEIDFYGLDRESPGGRLLYTIRDAASNPDPQSIAQRLKQAGVSVNKVVNFTNEYAKNRLPGKIRQKREYFAQDLARFFKEMQGYRSDLAVESYEIPATKDDYIKNGILKIDSRTLVFDTTLNNSILQVIKESGLQPGIIIKEFTFWRDGADEDVESLEKVAWANYGVTHWLTQYYDVYSRPRGSGFVTCNPTIYIRKPNSLRSAIKRSLSGILKRPNSR